MKRVFVTLTAAMLGVALPDARGGDAGARLPPSTSMQPPSALESTPWLGAIAHLERPSQSCPNVPATKELAGTSAPTP